MDVSGLRFVAMAICVLVVSSGCGSSGAEHRPPGGNGGAPGNVDAPIVPAKRGGAPAAWMPAVGEMVIFGGMDPITNDTYSFDQTASAWRQLTPERQGSSTRQPMPSHPERDPRGRSSTPVRRFLSGHPFQRHLALRLRQRDLDRAHDRRYRTGQALPSRFGIHCLEVRAVDVRWDRGQRHPGRRLLWRHARPRRGDGFVGASRRGGTKRARGRGDGLLT